MLGALRSHRARRSAAAGGWISFARYMELALHEPGVGYYASGARKFGAAGDFVTAPELGALFGRTLARQLPRRSARRSSSSARAAARSPTVAARASSACDYTASSKPAPTCARGSGTALGERVSWLDRLPERFRGVVIANEVVDAMPVHARRLDARRASWSAASPRKAAWAGATGRRSGTLLEAAQALEVPRRPTRARSACGARLDALARRACSSAGVILVIDYGFPRREYYHPQRATGTLMCHYRHQRARRSVPRTPAWRTSPRTSTSARSPRPARDAGLDVLGYAHAGAVPRQLRHHRRARRRPTSRTRCITRRSRRRRRSCSRRPRWASSSRCWRSGAGMHAPLLGFTRGDRSHTL